MTSVNQLLATEHGILLCSPPFVNTPCTEVRAVLFNSGQRKTPDILPSAGCGGHSQTQLGHGNRAYEYYRAYMPSAYNERAKVGKSSHISVPIDARPR